MGGRLDLLIHAAAEAAPLSPAEHVSEKDLDKAIALNFRVVQRLIRVTAPLLQAAPAVFIADPAAYGASKAASRAVVQSWAAEQARLGPRIWLAAPPPMPTAIRARAHPGKDRGALSSCADVAKRLVEKIAAADAAPGETLPL